MKTILTSIFGIDFPITKTPENLDECKTVANGEQGVVDTFVNHHRFHRMNTDIRASVVDAMIELTGVQPETELKKSPTKSDPNRQIEVRTEKPEVYFNRALAKSNQSLEEVTPLLQEAVGETEFYAVGEPRVAGAARTTKGDLVNAQILINAGAEKYNQAVSMLEQKNTGLVVERDEAGVPKLESLANALRTNRARAQAEENAALGIAA